MTPTTAQLARATKCAVFNYPFSATGLPAELEATYDEIVRFVEKCKEYEVEVEIPRDLPSDLEDISDDAMASLYRKWEPGEWEALTSGRSTDQQPK